MAPVTQQHVRDFVDIIERSFTDGNHRGVLNRSDWRTIYGVAPRMLAYLGHGGAPIPPPAPVDTVPCHDCGLVLPLQNIEIDHQRPVAGDTTEPVCKVFRAMGLTRAGPTGLKGQSVIATCANLVGGAVTGAGNLNARYTLSDRGQIFYSLVDWAGLTMDLEERCLNHVINLRPMCGACNSPTRNPRRLFP